MFGDLVELYVSRLVLFPTAMEFKIFQYISGRYQSLNNNSNKIEIQVHM